MQQAKRRARLDSPVSVSTLQMAFQQLVGRTQQAAYAKLQGRGEARREGRR